MTDLAANGENPHAKNDENDENAKDGELMTKFAPSAVQEFRIVAAHFDEESGVARCQYAFDDMHTFEEQFAFPLPDGGAKNVEEVQRAVGLLALAAGVSYYKAAVPRRLRVESHELTAEELDFLRRCYTDGLGEFAYVNGLHLQDHTEFIATICEPREVFNSAVENHALVAMGGGKDSCVSVELLRRGGFAQTLCAVVPPSGAPRPIAETIAASGLPSLYVERRIDPKLFALNAAGAYNGHVPVTIIVSLSLYCLALLHGMNALVLSNERSASIGNMMWDGVEINHQWAKSFAAEEMLANMLRHSITPNIAYFSLLRPLSELDIAKRFAVLSGSEKYFSVFTSCNRAFRIDATQRTRYWCGDCPKCRFVFLAMSPHFAPHDMEKIFGTNLLNDASQIAGFNELLGFAADKPFECVGEIEESLGAFWTIMHEPPWTDMAVVCHVREHVLPQLSMSEEELSDLVTSAFQPSTQHRIPERFQRVFL